jgi:hypothetical protein
MKARQSIRLRTRKVPRSGSDILSLGEVAELFAPLTRRPHTPLRNEKDKIRKRLDYQARKKVIAEAIPGKKVYWRADVLRWGYRLWGDRVAAAVPKEFRDNAPKGKAVSAEASGLARSTASVRPLTYQDCLVALEDAGRREARLRSEIDLLKAEIATLRPRAQRYAENCAKNRESARRPRGS